jgi:hypothetical protein
MLDQRCSGGLGLMLWFFYFSCEIEDEITSAR